MPVFEIDPLQDPRWNSFVESHPHSSIFHSAEWLRALHRTYQYKSICLTTSAQDSPLANGLLLCRIQSWLTGSKLVSLPFSDHCDPLVQSRADLDVLLSGLGKRTAGKFKYAEIRPRFMTPDSDRDWSQSEQYHFHALDLRPSLEDVYSRLHKDGVQRKIRRAERERVVVDQGNSSVLLQQFFNLMVLTRRRHLLPPQPFSWFRNLADSLGPRLTIYLARIDNQPIASILTLRHKKTMVYKYGCSDEKFHNAGGMPRLFWQAIQDAKSEQLEELDLGRSDEGNSGLVRFKDHLGAVDTPMVYWQFPRSEASAKTSSLSSASKSRLIQTVISRLPDRLFRLVGELFYRHAA